MQPEILESSAVKDMVGTKKGYGMGSENSSVAMHQCEVSDFDGVAVLHKNTLSFV